MTGAEDATLNVLLTDMAVLVIATAVCCLTDSLSPVLGMEAEGRFQMNGASLTCDATYSQHNMDHYTRSVMFISMYVKKCIV